MGTQPESKVSTKIIKEWRKLGAFAYKVHGGEYQMAGVPDISGTFKGLSVWCETKMPGNWEPSLKQKIRINAIRRAGGHVVVAYSVSDAVQMLEHIDVGEHACTPYECLYTLPVDPSIDWHPLILEGEAR